MSPSESDLRGALHDGEGEQPDVDVLIAGAQAVRARRRTRLLSSAAVVAVVACLGGGLGVLVSNSGNDSSAASSAGSAARPYDTDLSGTAAGNAARAPVAAGNASGADSVAGNAGTAVHGSAAGGVFGSATSTACPSTQPRYLLPGGGGTGQFGASGPLFSKPVTAIVVCSYGTTTRAVATTPSRPARLELTGSQAKRLAASLESAPKKAAVVPCPDIMTSRRHEIALIGIAADGSTAGTVTASLSEPPCNVEVTNGTAVRYGWEPPADLQKVLDSLSPGSGAIATLQAPSPNQGSPIHS